MQTGFTEDQDQFREIISRFMQDKSQPLEVRKLMESDNGYDPAVWQQMCSEVGVAATPFPEAYGGFGFGAIELGIVAEEMGRFLYCGPFFGSVVMAGSALLRAANEDAKTELLPEIAGGTSIAALVLDDLNSISGVGKSVTASNGKLNGVATLVVDAQVANRLVVIAGEGRGLGLYALPSETTGVSISPVEALDPTRKLNGVRFDQANATKIGEVTEAKLNLIWDDICVALAHEMISGAQHVLDSTIEYPRLRYQFGRPIGSFQALKHRCADLLLELELAKATTHHAARCLAANEGEPYAASMAKAMASDVYFLAAKEAVQMRGGIGFTWEEDTHLWYKRAKSSEVFMGTSCNYRERILTIIEEHKL